VVGCLNNVEYLLWEGQKLDFRKFVILQINSDVKGLIQIDVLTDPVQRQYGSMQGGTNSNSKMLHVGITFCLTWV
jgi:hypothetical protein